jgi:hypothetical protein
LNRSKNKFPHIDLYLSFNYTSKLGHDLLAAASGSLINYAEACGGVLSSALTLQQGFIDIGN